MIGRRVGRYRVLAELGKGGMSTVYRAHDELLGHEVALKVLSPELGQSDSARRRFRREMSVAASFDHPSIAKVYESAVASGTPYIAMALIDGETVAERLGKSLVPVHEALGIACQVAEGLGYAHTRGVIHRDVSSRNIMLARDGRVLLLDFGLALVTGASRVSSSTTLVGTETYMSPEVLLGKDADPRSDLYGLGVVLYEMLTGRTPFGGARREALIYAILNRAVPPPSEFRPESSALLDRVVLRLLARGREERYPNAEAFLAELNHIRAGVPPSSAAALASPSPAQRGRAALDGLESNGGPIYVAIPTFEIRTTPEFENRARVLATELHEALAASITRARHMHVVLDSTLAPGEDLAALARRVGAQMVMTCVIRLSAGYVRLLWRLQDPVRRIQVAAGSVRGAASDVLDLEAQLFDDIRSNLGASHQDPESDWRAQRPVPAEKERFQQAIRDLERFDREAAVDSAIATLEQLARAASHQTTYWAWLGRACLAKFLLTRQQSWETRAASAIERAREQGPDAAETLLALGELHTVTGRYEEASSCLRRALAPDPTSFDLRLALARALEAAARYEESEVECRRAIETRTEDWRGYHVLGLCLFKRGEFARAVEPWRQVLRLTPDNAQAASNLGSALFHLDQPDDAIAFYEKSIDLRPNKFAYVNLGTVLFYLGRYVEAAEAFEHAVALAPSDPVMWGNLGSACRLEPSMLPRATSALRQAIGLMQERLQRHPVEAEGWSRLAGWHANLDQNDSARTAIERALELAPHDVHVMVHAANVFCQLGDRDSAMAWLERAIDAGFGVEAIRRAPDLAPLRNDSRFATVLARRSGTTGSTGRAT